MQYIPYLPYIPNIPYFPNMPYQTDHTHHTYPTYHTTPPPHHRGGGGQCHTPTTPQGGEGKDLIWGQYMGPIPWGWGGGGGGRAWCIYTYIYQHHGSYVWLGTCPRQIFGPWLLLQLFHGGSKPRWQLTPRGIFHTNRINLKRMIGYSLNSSSAALPRSDDQLPLQQALLQTRVALPRAQLSFIPIYITFLLGCFWCCSAVFGRSGQYNRQFHSRSFTLMLMCSRLRSQFPRLFYSVRCEPLHVKREMLPITGRICAQRGQILGETKPKLSTEIRAMMFDYVRLFTIYSMICSYIYMFHVCLALGNMWKDDDFQRVIVYCNLLMKIDVSPS